VGLRVKVAVAVGEGVKDRVAVKVGVLVTVKVLVGVLVGDEGWGTICRASTLAFWSGLPEAAANWMVILPPEGLMLLNTSSWAISSPPAVALMSKLVSTWVPLMETFCRRWPDESKSSANFRVAW